MALLTRWAQGRIAYWESVADYHQRRGNVDKAYRARAQANRLRRLL
jgi:hypothetical protein